MRLRSIKTGDIFRTSYHLPHLVHTAKTYPLPSPNGSTLIVYGHTNGIRVIWSGGRHLTGRSHQKPPQKPQTNGIDKDVVMILDSDEEEPQANAESSTPDEPEFDYDGDEFDPSDPSASIVQYLDLILGTAVYHMSFPPYPSNLSFLPSTLPPIASEQIIIVAACGDCKTRVITLPSTPPSAEKKRVEATRIKDRAVIGGAGIWGEHIMILNQGHGYREIATHTAVTLIPKDTTTLDDASQDKDQGDGHLRRTSDGKPSQSSDEIAPPNSNQGWNLLIASVTSGVTATLLVYCVSVESVLSSSRGGFQPSMGQLNPIQTQHLPSPLSKIYFNPSLNSTNRQSRLLLIDSRGCVRIYNCRTGASDAPPPSPTSQASGAGGTRSDGGAWSLTLYPGFTSSGQQTSRGSALNAGLTRRKHVVDAKWVLGGKSVIVLLSDGEWGVWDIEGAGPMAEKLGKMVKGFVPKGIRGGATTHWNLQGHLSSPTSASPTTEEAPRQSGIRSAFLLRTPRTRKVQEQSLFEGPTTEQPSNARGSITVQPANAHASQKDSHERVVFWLGDQIVVMPDLWSYWENQVARKVNGGLGNLLDPTTQSRLVRLERVVNPGEIISDMDIFPMRSRIESGNDTPNSSSTRNWRPNILLAKNHQLVVLVSPQPEAATEVTGRKRLESFQPRLLTGSEDLGLEEIDRSLAIIDSRRRPENGRARKKVAFATTSTTTI